MCYYHVKILMTTGAVMALDRNSTALSRLWCCYEASIALRLLGQNRFSVAMPGGCEWTELLQCGHDKWV